MEKTILREARIRGRGVKKRCRKESYITLSSFDENDEKAIAKLYDEIKGLSEKYRTYSLEAYIEVYNIFRDDNGIISRKIFPRFSEHTNYKTFELEVI